MLMGSEPSNVGSTSIQPTLDMIYSTFVTSAWVVGTYRLCWSVLEKHLGWYKDPFLSFLSGKL